MTKILYDKNGSPEIVIMQYDEYQMLTKELQKEGQKPRDIKNLRRFHIGHYSYYKAIGYYKDSKLFCLLKGSLIKKRSVTSMKSSDLECKSDLINKSILEDYSDSDYLILTKHYRFSSPSQAAGVVDGTSKNGKNCFDPYESKGLDLGMMKPVYSSLKECLKEKEQLSIEELQSSILKLKDNGTRKYIENLPDQLLFSVIEHFYSDDFDFSEFPNIKKR